VQVAIKSGVSALNLKVEQYGDPERGTIMLIMGLGTQLIAWPKEFVGALAAAGYRVIRFDNRDVQRMRTYKVIGGPNQTVPEPVLREMARRTIERCADRTGSRRHLAAAQATGSLKRNLRDIHVPTLISHGLDDPLIAARRSKQLHRGIRGSKLLLLERMGHNLPRPLMPQIVQAIVENCARGS
jgi:pimeloyl-ACP methyl ester carboxylesterase